MIDAKDLSSEDLYSTAMEKALDVIESLVTPLAKKMESKITRTFKYAVDSFYDDYSPKVYKRRMDMYDMLVVLDSDVTRGDDYVSLRFDWQICPEFMTTFRSGYRYNYEDDDDEYPYYLAYGNDLFKMTFVEGNHGHPNRGIPPCEPSPYLYFLDEWKFYLEEGGLQSDADVVSQNSRELQEFASAML